MLKVYIQHLATCFCPGGKRRPLPEPSSCVRSHTRGIRRGKLWRKAKDKGNEVVERNTDLCQVARRLRNVFVLWNLSTIVVVHMLSFILLVVLYYDPYQRVCFWTAHPCTHSLLLHYARTFFVYTIALL